MLDELQSQRGRAQGGLGAFEGVHEDAAFAGFDLAHAGERLMHVGHQQHLGAHVAAHLHAVGAGALRHHHLGAAAQQARAPGQRDGVVACRHTRDAAGQRGGVQVQHHRERAAWLEAAGALEEFFFQPDLGARAHGGGQGVVHKLAHRRGDDARAQPRAVGADGGQAGDVDGGLGVLVWQGQGGLLFSGPQRGAAPSG